MRPVNLVAMAAVSIAVLAGCNRANEGKVVLHGNVDDRELQLAFVLSERVAEVIPEEGSSVSKGALIARLETVRIDNEIAAAKATLDASKALLAVAQANMDKSDNGSRVEDIAKATDMEAGLAAKVEAARKLMVRNHELVKTGAVSKQEVDDADAKFNFLSGAHGAVTNRLALLLAGDRAEDRAATRARLDEARASVERAAAQLAIAEQKRKDCELFAPADGIVRERLLEPGEFTSPMKPIISYALSNPKWVRCYLRETQLAQYKLNSPAKVTADGCAKPFEGWIGYVSPTAEFTPKNIETDELRPTLVYEIRVYVKDPEGLLKLGAPVVVEL